MSDEKQVATMPFADFTMKDLEIIEKFKEDGMIGLHTLVESDHERMMSLYLDGKSYRQIALLTKKHKSVVLFLAHKLKWFELRKEYLDELKATLPDKILDSKIQSQEFLMELIMAYRKKIGRNINEYLRTDNVEFHDRIDKNDVMTVMKVMELLHKLNSENLGNTDKSMVSLNGLAEGVTITKTGNNSVEITPKVSPFNSKLKQFAEMKRQQEKQAAGSPHDISSEEPQTEKEEEK